MARRSRVTAGISPARLGHDDGFGHSSRAWSTENEQPRERPGRRGKGSPATTAGASWNQLGARATIWLMFCGSPFFGYPHKPLLALAYGSRYQRTYQHFRAAHSDPGNLARHLLGLGHAICANMALLQVVDTAVFGADGVAYFSWATLLGWAALLTFWTETAPAATRVLAVASLVAGFAVRAWVVKHWALLLWAEGVQHALIWKWGDGKAMPYLPASLPFGVVMIAHFGLQHIARGHTAVLAPLSAEINLATMAFVIWGSYKPLIKASWIKTPLGFLGPNVYWCGVIGWLLAVLTDQPWLYLHGAGFSASLFQGVSHRWSGEAANLPELALRSEVEGAGDEIGHVSYFPVLIFHASFQTLGWCTPRAHPALELGQGAVPGLASI